MRVRVMQIPGTEGRYRVEAKRWWNFWSSTGFSGTFAECYVFAHQLLNPHSLEVTADMLTSEGVPEAKEP